MHRHDEVLAGSQAQAHARSRRPQPVHVREQRVDHRVADEEDPLVGDASAAQVLDWPTSLVVKNQLVIASVTMRLISSGIVQSPERMPASTCATGTCSFCAAMAQAIVELTSPTTRHSSARLLEQQLLVARHDRGRLLGLRAGADLEVDVGLRDAELRRRNRPTCAAS